jgi:predicted secreted protein
MTGGKGGDPAPNPSSPQADSANSQPGGDLGGAPQGSGTGNETKLAAWTQQLSKELRENPEYSKGLAGFEKLDDLAKGYLELQNKSDIPGDKATPEEKAAFWKKLGYPEKPESYAVAKEQGAETFIAAAHTAHLTDEQSTALWEAVSEGTARQRAASQQAQVKELAATDAALQKEYGDTYNRALEFFNRGVGSGEVKNLLMQAGLAGNPQIVKAFIALGEAAQEPGSPKSDALPGQGMKSIFDGGTLYG